MKKTIVRHLVKEIERRKCNICGLIGDYTVDRYYDNEGMLNAIFRQIMCPHCDRSAGSMKID